MPPSHCLSFFQPGACHQHSGRECHLGLRDGSASLGLWQRCSLCPGGGAGQSLPSCPSDVGVALGAMPLSLLPPWALGPACQISVREEGPFHGGRESDHACSHLGSASISPFLTPFLLQPQPSVEGRGREAGEEGQSPEPSRSEVLVTWR